MKQNSQGFIINGEDDELLIPKLFFNTLTRFGFISSIERLIDHRMVADEYNGCSFPGDVDAEESPFKGVKFRYLDDEVIVDEPTFNILIKEVCEFYIQKNPTQEESVRQMLKRIRKA